MSRCMIPGMQAVVEREMRRAAGQAEILMTGAAQIEGGEGERRMIAKAAGEPAIARQRARRVLAEARDLHALPVAPGALAADGDRGRLRDGIVDPAHQRLAAMD